MPSWRTAALPGGRMASVSARSAMGISVARSSASCFGMLQKKVQSGAIRALAIIRGVLLQRNRPLTVCTMPDRGHHMFTNSMCAHI